MKTILNFKWYILGILSLSIFTSCISDGDNEIYIGEDLAYITTVDGKKYAAISYGYLSASSVQNMTPGQYYLIGYKISDYVLGGVNQGEIVNIIGGKPLDQSYLNISSVYTEGVDVAGIQIGHWSPLDHYADGWSVYFQAQKEGKNKLVPYFYYDAENQIDEDGKDVSQESNKVIIDVRFIESDEEFESNNPETQITVANLRDLRYEYTPDFSNAQTDEERGKFVNVTLKFRYNKAAIGNNDAAVSYLGSWDTTSRDCYYMIFTEE